MAKGYWIYGADVDDAETYQRYVAANAEAFRAHGARFLVRGGAFENPEGASRSRNVVLEFPSYGAALECYRSQFEPGPGPETRLSAPGFLDLVEARARVAGAAIEVRHGEGFTYRGALRLTPALAAWLGVTPAAR